MDENDLGAGTYPLHRPSVAVPSPAGLGASPGAVLGGLGAEPLLGRLGH